MGYWLRAHAAYDTELAQEALAGEIEKIRPWSGTAA
jgi:antitoxin HigA-1